METRRRRAWLGQIAGVAAGAVTVASLGSTDYSFRVAWDLTSARLLIRLEDDADVSVAASLP
jgi:hypothetical protein